MHRSWSEIAVQKATEVLCRHLHMSAFGATPISGVTSLVVVEGDPTRSRLLMRAIPLSDRHQNVLPEMTELLGLFSSITA